MHAQLAIRKRFLSSLAPHQKLSLEFLEGLKSSQPIAETNFGITILFLLFF